MQRLSLPGHYQCVDMFQLTRIAMVIVLKLSVLGREILAAKRIAIGARCSTNAARLAELLVNKLTKKSDKRTKEKRQIKEEKRQINQKKRQVKEKKRAKLTKKMAN